MVRAMCCAKLMEKKRTEDLMAKVNGVRWYRHVLRRDDRHVLRRNDGHVLRKAMEFGVKDMRKRGRLRKMWKKQVEKES